jgi:RNA polymerase subunit RPABC4/transcription elongation factor Spt4
MARRVRHGSGGGAGGSGGFGGGWDGGDEDWDLAEGLDPEGPSAADLDRYGDEMVACIHCGAKIYDQAELCPRCGAIQEEVEKGVSWWVYGVVVVLVGLLLMFVF